MSKSVLHFESTNIKYEHDVDVCAFSPSFWTVATCAFDRHHRKSDFGWFARSGAAMGL